MIYVGKYPSINLKSENSMFVKFVKFDQLILDKIKSLPVRKYVPDEKVWEIPISDIDRLVNTIGLDNISLFTEFKEFDSYVKYHNEVKLGRKSPEELKEYYKNLQSIVDYNFKTKPRGHQIEAFNIGIQNDVLLITDEMGIGKTKESLDIMDYRKFTGACKHVLVICGVNSLKYNWVNEIAIHSWNNCQVIEGTKKQKLDKLQASWMFYYTIINIEALRSKICKNKNDPMYGIEQNELLSVVNNFCNHEYFSGIIFDEFHKCNNRKSQQGKSLDFLNSKFKIAMSGTPITKRIEGSWNILRWLGIENSTYWNYVIRYCELGGFTGYQTTSYKNLDELHEKINRFQIRRTKDILDLPPKTHQTVYIDMTREETKSYKELKAGIINDLESGEIKFLNPLAATTKLRQFTDQLKLKAVQATVIDLHDNDEACAIFSCFKSPIYELESQLKHYNPLILTGDIKKDDEKQNIVNTFQTNKRHSAIIGTIQAMGTGFTLTRASYVLFLNKSWIVGDNDQAEDRCHRIGTEKNVTIVSFIVKHTIDERVEEILANDKLYISKVIDGAPLFKVDKKDLLAMLMRD